MIEGVPSGADDRSVVDAVGAPTKSVFIFLDVDGVLNSMRSIVAYRGVRWEHIDPVAVRLLDRLCIALSEAGRTPHVVISSTWRMMHPHPAWWNDRFSALGCAGVSVVGCTQVFNDNDPMRRGREVAAWMAKSCPLTTPPYVCLDDDDDFLPGQPLEWVDPDFGLQVADIDAAYRRLIGEPMPGLPRIIRPSISAASRATPQTPEPNSQEAQSDV